MRFKHKPYPKHGDIRYNVFFAWLPITIGLETRWLERVSVKQEYINNRNLRTFPLSSYWLNLAFEQQPLPDYRNPTKLIRSKINRHLIKKIKNTDESLYTSKIHVQVRRK